MRYRITVEWDNENGSCDRSELGEVECGPCASAADVGLKLADVKDLMSRLQRIVVTRQLSQHCATTRRCPGCDAPRNIKDHRTRALDSVLGRVVVDAPRFDGCQACGEHQVVSPLSRLLPKRVLPELCHLQAKVAAELSYRRATELLRELLPETGGLTPVTNRNRTLVVGNAIETELCQEVEHPQPLPDPAEHLTVGIDGAFVKAKRKGARERRNFEILTGRIERERGRGQAFAVVRDLDKRAKQKVQAVLRRAGRTAETAITILSDGEDGLRGVVGWFGRKCEHRLDWFHVSRRIAKIHKQLLYLPNSPIFGCRLAYHAKNLNRVKWKLGTTALNRRIGE